MTAVEAVGSGVGEGAGEAVGGERGVGAGMAMVVLTDGKGSRRGCNGSLRRDSWFHMESYQRLACSRI